MLDLEQLKSIAQLVDNMDLSAEELNKAYSKNDAEEFRKIKQKILDSQAKISSIIIGGSSQKQ
jgi:hypothetical protein